MYQFAINSRVERSFGTDQDRLVKELRLAKVKTLQAANEFLEREYWPEWNERFARPLTGIPDVHRPLTGQLDLAAILSHVEHRVITNDYTFSFVGRRYQIARQDVKAGMKGQRVRLELRLDGELQARYEGRPLEVSECGPKPQPPVKPAPLPKSVRKHHNAGGKSQWMESFFDRPGPELWQAIAAADSRS